MTNKLFVFLILISKIGHATVFSVQSGKWGDGVTWSSGKVPLNTDTVLIKPNHQISLSMDSNSCAKLVVEGTVHFSSPNKSLTCNEIVLKDESAINSQVLGNIQTQFLITENTTIEGINLTVLNKMQVQGITKFKRKSGSIELHHLFIGADGNWLPENNRNFEIDGNVFVDGEFNSGKGKYFFNGKDTISGNLVTIENLIATGQVFVKDSLRILSSAIGEQLGSLNALPFSFIELQLKPSDFTIVKLDLTGAMNTLLLSGGSEQVIPVSEKKHYENIVLKTQKRVVLQDTLFLKGDLVLMDYSILELSGNKIITTGIQQLLQLNNSSTIYFNQYQFDINTLLKGFSKREWLHTSFLNIKSASSHRLLDNNFKNLTIDFLSDSARLTLQQDILTINGDLKLGSNTVLDGKAKQFVFFGNVSGGVFLHDKNTSVRYAGNKYQHIGAYDYNHLIFDNSTSDTLSFEGNFKVSKLEVKQGYLKMGSLSVDSLFVGNSCLLLITGVNPSFSKQVVNDGKIHIVSNSVRCTFNGRLINNGEILNKTSSDHRLSGTVINNGFFEACSGTGCTWEITDNTKFEGIGSFFFPRVEIGAPFKLTNAASLSITESCKGGGRLVNESTGELILGMNDDQFLISLDAFSNPNNQVVYHSVQNQNIGNNSNGTYQNLRLTGGYKKINNDVFIKKKFAIKNNARIDCGEHQIHGDKNGSFSLMDSSSLVLGNPTVDNAVGFPVDYLTDSCFISPTSTVHYNSWKNQLIRADIKYGNLTISDGTGIKNSKGLTNGDSLIVKGDLSLLESSVFFDTENSFVSVFGDWKGPGTLNSLKGRIELYGNADNSGQLIAEGADVIYKGIKSQRIKVANYFNLLIDKQVGKASINAGNGEFRVENTLYIKKGKLIVNGEKTTVSGHLLIADSLVFASKVQQKKFKDITLLSNGYLGNLAGVDLIIKGNVFNKGVWTNNGGVVDFSDSTKNQEIINEGVVNFYALKLDSESQKCIFKGKFTISDTISLTGTDLQLENSIFTLQKKAYIKGESNHTQIRGNNSSIIYTGNLDSGNFKNFGGLGLSLKSDKSISNLKLTRTFNTYLLDGITACLKPNFELTTTDSLGIGNNLIIQINYLEYWLGTLAEENLALYTGSTNVGFSLKNSVKDSDNNTILADVKLNKLILLGNENLTVLPVSLIDFTAKQSGDDVLLNWEVGFEWDVFEYKILKEDSEKALVIPSSKEGKNIRKTYVIKDVGQFEPTYYTLYECDVNDNCNALKRIYYYPVFSKQTAIKSYYQLQEFIKYMDNSSVVSIYSFEGKLLARITTGSELPNLLFGSYLATIQQQNKLSSLKFILNSN